MSPGTALKPSFHGNGGTLFGIHLKNLLLTILTLGIYAFWGRADIRRYLYGQTALAGDRFAFDGTGGEMLRGWIKAVGIIIVGAFAAGILTAFVHQVVGIVALYAGLAFFFFPLALIGSRRYRLNRTSWRGVRFGFTGEVGEFIAVYVPGVLLTLVTLGLYSPIFHANVRKYLVDRTRFGDRSFKFTGEGKELFGRFLLALLLTPLTLGIAFPWAQVRAIEYQCQNLTLVGDAGFEAVLQQAGSATATGEELGEVLDVELIGADFFGL
jgi:uncharacterized membrane protein YjgN (DUF898 family)